MTTCINCGCDPEVLDRGILINRIVSLACQILKLKENILAWEKQARKTPAKTMLKEWEKVSEAKVALEKAKSQLDALILERRRLLANPQTPNYFRDKEI